MEHNKITRPDEIQQLSPDQLFQRVKPILRAGGLLASSALLQRVKPNLHRICWELGERWRQNPKLNGVAVGFDAYLVTTLCNTLRANDRHENPGVYDPHGKYQPNRETLELTDEIEAPTFILGKADDRIPSRHSWETLLAHAAANAGIEAASITALLSHVTGVASGTTRSPYKLARELGLSTDVARHQPATAPYLAIAVYLDALLDRPVATTRS